MNLLECLSAVKDPRRKQGQRFELTKLLLLIIMGMMRGCYHYHEIARFCRNNQSDLSRFLNIKSKHMPSHITVRQLVMSIDFASLPTAFHTWSKQHVPISENEWIAIEGKAIKSTVSDPHGSYQNFICLVLFSQKRELVVFAEKFDSKETSEITVAEQFIEALDLKDVIFTLDTQHCQKTLQTIVDSENHFLVKIKTNQPTLLQTTKDTVEKFEVIKPLSCQREKQRERRNSLNQSFQSERFTAKQMYNN